MIKKILLILLIPSIVLIAFLGRNYLKNEEEVDRITKYVDCDDIYVGTYAGWIEAEYSSELLGGYEKAKQIIKTPPLAPSRAPIAVFVDIDDNVRIESVNSSEYSFTGKINEDGSFEINQRGVIFSGKFVFDEESSRLSASGTSEYTESFGGLAPSSTWEVEAFDISLDCYVSEEILHDLADEKDIEKEFESEDKVFRIKSGGINEEVILGTDTGIKYNRDAEDVLIEVFRGHIIVNVDKLPEGRKYEVASPHAVITVRGTKFVMDVKEEKTVVFVEEGEVEVSSLDGEKSITLTDGQMVVIIGDEFPKDVVNI